MYVDEVAGLEKTNFVILIVILLSIALLIFFFYLGCTFVDCNFNKILERKGRYKRTLSPGFRFFIPVLDKIVGTVDMSKTIFNSLNPVVIPLKTTGTIEVHYSLSYVVFDAKQFYYSKKSVEFSLASIVSNCILKTCVLQNIDSIERLFGIDFTSTIKQLYFTDLGIVIDSFEIVGVNIKK